MLVYPSLYEGFGLPPVEAMGCGTPSVVSNTTSLPEAVGNAAVQVDPTSIEAIADGMARLIDNSALRDELIQAGLEHVKTLTWKNTAEALLNGMRAVGSQKS